MREMIRYVWSQDHLFAATGDLLKLVVFDRVNASRVLKDYNVDASLTDVTVLDDVIHDHPPGEYTHIFIHWKNGST